MNCPECNYELSPFDDECPRCKRLAAEGRTPHEPRDAGPAGEEGRSEGRGCGCGDVAGAICLVGMINVASLWVCAPVAGTGRAALGWEGTLNEQAILAWAIGGGLTGLIGGTLFANRRWQLRVGLMALWLVNGLGLVLLYGTVAALAVGAVGDWQVPSELGTGLGLGVAAGLTLLALSSPALPARVRASAIALAAVGLVAVPVYCHLHGAAYLRAVERQVVPAVGRFASESVLVHPAEASVDEVSWYGIGSRPYVCADGTLGTAETQVRVRPTRKMRGPDGAEVTAILMLPLTRPVETSEVPNAAAMQRLLAAVGVGPELAGLFRGARSAGPSDAGARTQSPAYEAECEGFMFTVGGSHQRWYEHRKSGWQTSTIEHRGWRDGVEIVFEAAYSGGEMRPREGQP